ncbi:MAG TPA: glycosyltransferase family 39 protein, partial [Ignavibacteria bacterium]
MNKKTSNLLLFSIVIIFLSLRLAFITQKNLWFDEIFSWNLTLGSFYEILVRTSNDIHPPLYYFVLKVWNYVVGDSVLSMRLLSAIFSTATLFFVYPLSKKILDRYYSYLFLVLFAVNPLNIFYSQEVRMSAMNLFLNAGAVYFLLKIIEREQLWKLYFKQSDIYFYILFCTLALYTHYFSFFIFVVEIIFALFVRRSGAGRTKVYLMAISGVLLLYLAWIPTFLEQITRGQSWRSMQDLTSAGYQLINFIKDINLGLYYHYTNLQIVSYISIFLIVIYLAASVMSFPVKLQSTDFLIFLLVIIPVLQGLIISVRQKVEFYRYLSIIIPFVLIFIINGISK